MPTADAHVHLFGGGYAGQLGRSPAGDSELDAYERLRAYHGIARALVVGYEGESRYGGNTQEVLALARERPWIAALAYLSPGAPPAVSTLRTLESAGARGFAVYLPDEVSADALAQWPVAVFDELRHQRAIISVNAPPGPTNRAAGTLAALDECRVLFSHLGLPGSFAGPPDLEAARDRLAPLLSLARAEHVAVKLSGLYAISQPPHDFPHRAAQPIVDLVLEAFGPARVMWGSDFSPALDYVSFAQLVDPSLLARCTAAEIEAVMGTNLITMLDERHPGS